MTITNAGWTRRFLSTAVAAVLAVAGTAVALVTPSPANAAQTYVMLVNDYYDGTAGHGDGQMRCLSTNTQPASGGSGTYMVYLAVCNPAVNGQWWKPFGTMAQTVLQGSLKDGDGDPTELSSNNTPPPGYSGIYSAYTAKVSNAAGHMWFMPRYDDQSGDLNKYVIESRLNSFMLSASHSDPYGGNTYRVYTSAGNGTGQFALPRVQQQVWRKYTPARPV